MESLEGRRALTSSGIATGDVVVDDSVGSWYSFSMAGAPGGSVSRLLSTPGLS